MNLLILAQKVDLDDSVFSFFHRWIAELAKHFEQVIVICLYEGRHSLPPNVRVLSLGKESFPSRIKYIRKFYRYIWRERAHYDRVFIHQNQEYSILGGPLFKMWGKKIFMWRNHYAGSIMTDIAAFFCNKVFCTSKYSYTAKYKKTVLMPVGVDTDYFKPDPKVSRIPRSILSLGRISPSKRIHLFVEAIGLLGKQGIQFTASIYGDALAKDVQYLENLKTRVKELGLDDSVTLHAGIPNNEAPEVFSRYDIFVNLSISGMLDKTIFEAMACETVALTCNMDLALQLDPEHIFIENDTEDLTRQLSRFLTLSHFDRDVYGKRLRYFVEENHSLEHLGVKISKQII
ncbi:MAG: glycosyltransferase family 4 protein [Candidatus Taylorbacteria bacterium]